MQCGLVLCSYRRPSLRKKKLWAHSEKCHKTETAPDNEKKRSNPLRRITNSFKSEPDPQAVAETNTRKRKPFYQSLCPTYRSSAAVENTPNGFPRLAAFQSSEANFSLYRSFSYLHSRVLLDLQDEITTLEKELDEIDWDDFDDEPDRLRSRDIDVAKASQDGNARNRRVILREIKDKLMEYGPLSLLPSSKQIRDTDVRQTKY